MEEEFSEIYNEWANDELIWSKGQFNWCRAYSKEEWENRKCIKDDCNYDIEIPF